MKKLILLALMLAGVFAKAQTSPTISWNSPVITINGVDYQVIDSNPFSFLHELEGVSDDRLFSERYAGNYARTHSRSFWNGEWNEWHPYNENSRNNIIYSFSEEEEYWVYGSMTAVEGCRSRNTQISPEVWTITSHTTSTLSIESYVNDDPAQGVEQSSIWYIRDGIIHRDWTFSDGFILQRRHAIYTDLIQECTATQDEILDLTDDAGVLIRRTPLLDYNTLNNELIRIESSTMYALSDNGYTMLISDLNTLIANATAAVSRNTTDTLTLGEIPYEAQGTNLRVNLTAVIDDGAEQCFPYIEYSFDGGRFDETNAWSDTASNHGCDFRRDDNYNNTHWVRGGQLLITAPNENWNTLTLRYIDRVGNTASVTTQRTVRTYTSYNIPFQWGEFRNTGGRSGAGDYLYRYRDTDYVLMIAPGNVRYARSSGAALVDITGGTGGDGTPGWNLQEAADALLIFLQQGTYRLFEAHRGDGTHAPLWWNATYIDLQNNVVNRVGTINYPNYATAPADPPCFNGWVNTADSILAPNRLSPDRLIESLSVSEDILTIGVRLRQSYNGAPLETWTYRYRKVSSVTETNCN